MSKKDLNRTELSALLDGEIPDVAQVEELGRQLESDSALKAEFEEQRSVKALLASLPEHEAPDFLATRVMGEIATGRGRRSPAGLWRNLGLVATGFVLSLALVATISQLNSRQSEPVSPNLADNSRMFSGEAIPVLDPGFDSRYSVPMMVPENFDWQYVPHAEGVEDERIQQFLKLAQNAHSYRVLVEISESASPDMADAILVLDQGGGE